MLACHLPSAAGCTDGICSSRLTGRSSVILIQYEYADNEQANLLRIAILYHELGHADDFKKGINFNHHTLTFHLPKAEEYADAFAKQYLQEFNVRKGNAQFTIWDFYNERRCQREI